MYEYHVTCGAFKKIIKSESNITTNIHDLIKKAFSLDLNCPLHLQYWHPGHNDWLDCEESDEKIEGTKLNVWQNTLGLQKLESSSSSTLSSSNISLHPSTSSINFTSSTVFEECSPVDQQPSQQRNIADFPDVYKLPKFPLWLQNLLDTDSPLCKEAKCQRAVTDVLFEDLLQYGYYPTSRMFQETCWALVTEHPILKDKESANGQPHDSWVLRLRDKFKKFRSRHAELCNAEELKRMKEKFGHKRDRNRLDSDNCLDDTLMSVKNIKKMFYVVQLDSDIFKEKMVIPSIWLDKNDTLCLLPPITDIKEVETLAKAQCTPKHGWQMHCVSFTQSFDTYSQAKENINKDKAITIKLEEEEIKHHHKEVREKRKRKLPQYLEQYSIESDDDEEEDRGSTQEVCTMDHGIVLYPAIVKIERLENLNVPENDQQSRLNTTHNKSSSSIHSTLEHDSQLQAVTSSSSIKRMKFAIAKFITEYDYVAIISSNWITDDRDSCRYPNSPNVERLLKKRIEPTPDWKTYQIEIMKEYETFSEAQEHLTEVEDTSNSDSEPDHCLKRKRTAAIPFNNEELEEDKISSHTSLDPFSRSTQPVSISSITNSISSITSTVPSISSISSVSSFFHSIESSTRSSELSPASSSPIASQTSEISTYKTANDAADYYENNSDIEPYSTDDGHRMKKKKQYDLSDSESEQIPLKKKKTLKNNANLIRVTSPPAFSSTSRSQGLFLETPRSSQVNQKCSCNTELLGLMEKTLKEIELLKKEMVEMRQENKHLAQKICFGTTIEGIEGFPLTSIQELLVLNTTLEDHEEFSKYHLFVKYQLHEQFHKQTSRSL